MQAKRICEEVNRLIKSIFLNQDKEYLGKRYEKAISKENLEFTLNYLVSSIEVGEIYDFYIVNEEDVILDSLNLYVEEIVPIFELEEDYLILGTDQFDKEIEVKLSETEFWTS